MAHLGTGGTPEPEGVLGVVAHAALQEPATRVGHRNTGRLDPDPVLAAAAR